jgi:hypothetical protein
MGPRSGARKARPAGLFHVRAGERSVVEKPFLRRSHATTFFILREPSGAFRRYRPRRRCVKKPGAGTRHPMNVVARCASGGPRNETARSRRRCLLGALPGVPTSLPSGAARLGAAAANLIAIPMPGDVLRNENCAVAKPRLQRARGGRRGRAVGAMVIGTLPRPWVREKPRAWCVGTRNSIPNTVSPSRAARGHAVRAG